MPGSLALTRDRRDLGNYMRLRLLLFTLLLPVLAQGAELPNLAYPVIDSYLDDKETETSGKVYAKATRYLAGDLNNDGRHDIRHFVHARG